MPDTTERLALPHPLEDDAADVPSDFLALVNRLDEIAAVYDQGTLGARPLAGTAGSVYFATDTGEASLDTGTEWVTLPTTGDQRFVSIGDLKFSARKAEHEGWIVADGRALAPGAYPALRELLLADGSAFGVSGANPLIPDLRGRAPVGVGNAPPGMTGNYTHGLKFGSELVALAIANMPSHNHGGATGACDRSLDHLHGYTYPGSSSMLVQGGAVASHFHFPQALSTGGMDRSIDHLHSIAAQGSGTGHENRPPILVANWFVYAGEAT